MKTYLYKQCDNEDDDENLPVQTLWWRQQRWKPTCTNIVMTMMTMKTYLYKQCDNDMTMKTYLYKHCDNDGDDENLPVQTMW